MLMMCAAYCPMQNEIIKFNSIIYIPQRIKQLSLCSITEGQRINNSFS